jgi:glycosyltransferase involved in cell wall biosynthesis
MPEGYRLPMRVCLIAPIPPFRGGISKYCYGLATELEKRHELLLLSYQRQYPALLFRKSQTDPAIDVNAVKSEFRGLSYEIDSVSIVSWFETARKVAAYRPDLVILPWFVVYWAPMYLYLLRFLRSRGIKVVIPCINVFEHEDNAFKRFLSKTVLRSVDALLVHSEQEKNEILAFHPTATVKKHLLPLFDYESPSQNGRGGGLKLLFFGCVRPYKGLDILLQAMALLKEHDVSLQIAGEFWYDKERYLQIIKDLGIGAKIDIVDQYIPNDELSRYFAFADLVVLPYKNTKTSGIIATAYGFGKPVLATDVGGFHEVVKDRYTGRVVPPDDPHSIAEGILWFLANRQISFSANIEDFASRYMSWSSLVDTLEEL